jgi:hypothetical protein
VAEAREKDAEAFRSMVSQLFEAIYVDVRRDVRLIVGVTPQPEYRHFIAGGTAVAWKWSSDGYTGQEPVLNEIAPDDGGDKLGSGDPEGIRTPDLHRDRVAC